MDKKTDILGIFKVKDKLRSVPLFEHLTDEQLQELEKIVFSQKFQPGFILFREGDNGKTFYIIASGSAKIYTEKDGQEKIITIFRAGDSFGELALLDGENRSASVQILEPSVLLSISHNDFFRFLEGNFSFTRQILKQLSSRIRKANKEITDMVFLDVETRVLKVLADLAMKHGIRENNMIRIDIKIGLHEIGKLVGISQQVVNGVLTYLHRNEIITFENHYIYMDASKLVKK
ncbi:CRP/FNR family transcriptional regulator [Aneurinibacillus soli]|uniref:cAMP receptor protein n=1 Tax=Aneurinibacillus soli TaxID=1500254 RepID=A0A0U5BMZ5_9BACL|nr:Crp/Fnr family transcriptional regulator [Aneurinibacillus soli]PYE59146.1 CRP/FNR family transcriptional regulator [Aneurinibacillus soli]BAU29566.1 cAMP receptor protein [Aneurinibacillus soli]